MLLTWWWILVLLIATDPGIAPLTQGWCTPKPTNRTTHQCVRIHCVDALLHLQRESGLAEDDDRFHAITKFLSETEDYLNKLASKIAMVGMLCVSVHMSAQLCVYALICLYVLCMSSVHLSHIYKL